MTLSARIPVGVDAAGFVPELWSKSVLEAVHDNLVVVPLVDHTWEPELKFGDTMNVGIINTVTATEVAIGTEGVVKNIASGSKVPIIVNQYWEAPVVLDDMTDLQSQVNLVRYSQLESGIAIATKMDGTLCDLFSSLDTNKGTDGAAMTDNVIINCIETLDEANVPTTERSWIFDPSVRADMYKIDKFVRTDYVRMAVVPTGMLGEIYGSRVYITNNLTVQSTGNYGAYLHKRALAIIAQEKSRVDLVRQPLKHQITINTTALWGVKEMRGTFGICVYTRKS